MEGNMSHEQYRFSEIRYFFELFKLTVVIGILVVLQRNDKVVAHVNGFKVNVSAHEFGEFLERVRLLRERRLIVVEERPVMVSEAVCEIDSGF